MKRIWWLVILLLMGLESCMPSHGEVAKGVAFRTVPNPEQWALGNEPAYLVVTEKNWSRCYSSPPSGSDFTTYIYLVASRGAKPNPGYQIRVIEVRQLEDRVTIKLELKEPDPGKMYPQVIVRPVAVAEVAKADLEPGGMLDFVFIDQKG
jgi:hypothetical protein